MILLNRFMNKILIALFIFLINTVSHANDQSKELDKLFIELKKNIPSKSVNIEQKIWLLWSTHPSDEKLTALLDEGSKLVKNQKFIKIGYGHNSLSIGPRYFSN